MWTQPLTIPNKLKMYSSIQSVLLEKWSSQKAQGRLRLASLCKPRSQRSLLQVYQWMQIHVQPQLKHFKRSPAFSAFVHSSSASSSSGFKEGKKNKKIIHDTVSLQEYVMKVFVCWHVKTNSLSSLLQSETPWKRSDQKAQGHLILHLNVITQELTAESPGCQRCGSRTGLVTLLNSSKVVTM